MKYRILYTIAFTLIFFLTHSLAYGFEGNITFVKQTYYDTSYFTYTVKDKMVRIDEKNSQNQIIQSLIIDLQNNKIVALSPSQRMYTYIQSSNKQWAAQKDVTYIKSDNFKYIDGHKCYLWRVRNVNTNTEVSLWVSESDFDFFDKVTEMLGGSEDYSRFCLYFNNIPNSRGYFPILTVEKTLLREEKSKIAVQHIDAKKVDSRLFSIPNNYKFLRY